MSTARMRALEKASTAKIPTQTVDYSQKFATEIYGTNVFGEAEQRKYLTKVIYKALRKTVDTGSALDRDLADQIAKGMKQWAIEKGVSHYTHWFTPLTGLTAEKHDSFLSPDGEGLTIAEFGGKELLQGEPDASSFPSGGIRATFEARGYTAWDPTSPVFIRESLNGKTLTIPTAFCSWTGEALDLKTPLLRSNEALSKQAVRLLKFFGKNVNHIGASVGPEQEYFLIDKAMYTLRPDLIASGRSLFGAPPPKGQELEDHYFGSIKDRILAYMQEMEMELFKLGIPAKTRHNEVAPAQFELAPVYENVNIGSDHNLMVMEVMTNTAVKHGLVCLLHEKPFKGVNGSGKHNNWSLGGPEVGNLLEPGLTPHDNAQFLTVLTALIRAVDKYQGVLRASVATAGNDHRLGANEAPPAIISVFLGSQLAEIIEQLASGTKTSSNQGGDLKVGVTAIPPLRKDATDRNRTSPFAFTGNKFEFRAQGSSTNIALVNTVLNTITAESLEYICDQLDAAIKGGKDFTTALNALLKDILGKHKRICFDGNGYSQEWHNEAAKRGLRNAKNTPEALKAWVEPETIALFEKYHVLSAKESESREEIFFERYNKTLNIEAQMTIEIARSIISPAAMKYQKQLADGLVSAKSAAPKADFKAQESLLEKIAGMNSGLLTKLDALQVITEKALGESVHKAAIVYLNEVIPAMNAVRDIADSLELYVDDSIWPLPKYRELLFVY